MLQGEKPFALSPVMPEIATESTPAHHVGTWAALLRHFRTLSLGEGASRLIGVAAIVLLAHRVTPSDFGLVMLGLMLTGWLSISIDAGTEALGIREVSRNPDRMRQIVEPILGLRLALSGIAIGVFAAIAWLMTQQPRERAVLLLFAAVLPMVGMNLRTMVLGTGATTALALGNVASQIAFFAGVASVVRGPNELIWVPVFRAAAEFGYGAMIIITLRPRFGFIRPRINLRVWARILRECAAIFANGVAKVITFSSGVLLTGFMAHRREDVGFYAAAHRPVVFCTAVTGLLLVSFLASYSAVDCRSAGAAQMFRRTVWLGATTIPLAILVTATSSTILWIVYGRAYVPAAPTLALLIWVMPIVLVGGPYGIALLATHHQRQLLRNSVVGATVTVAGTVAGVAIAGIIGAAAAAVAAQGLVAVLNYRTSVALGVAPPFEIVVMGQSWRKTS